jgi:hypothetical protein
VRIDQSDADDLTPAHADAPEPMRAAASEPPREQHEAEPESEPEPRDAAARTERSLEHRANVDSIYLAYAIDQGCARVEKIEDTVITPTMGRIEAEDANRHLVGLDHRLKGRDRLGEKVMEAMTERVRTVEQALATVKDAIRYTFCYPEGQYTDGVPADCDRLEEAGFEPIERRNSWSHEEYKGINSRWRVPGSGQLFEVQFHTRASLEAKQETHWAYERLRDPATSKAEQETMSAYQREVSSRISIPPGATDIPDYRHR